MALLHRIEHSHPVKQRHSQKESVVEQLHFVAHADHPVNEDGAVARLDALVLVALRQIPNLRADNIVKDEPAVLLGAAGNWRAEEDRVIYLGIAELK